MKENEFTESSRELRNPNRGFYNLYRFMITDDVVNYRQQIQALYQADENTSLSMVEVNLQNYRDSEISEAGMANIEALFQALGGLDKQLIVRFLYDWDGENEKYEPETIETVLNHMAQLEGVLRKADRQIFVIQGLFIGNWGEMNGTRYSGDGDLARLTEQLDRVSGQSSYLAVRTPSQWRRIIGLQDLSLPKEVSELYPLSGRVSLYNDGMLGNESDYGTYRVYETNGKKISEREDELEFQENLCRLVPNGGEVINDNHYNDFYSAMDDLASMHVTYLNEGHDQTVLEKWKNAQYAGNSCFKGMDGYTYIERHLGYRLLIDEVNFHSRAIKDSIEVNVTMKNVGFAPLYTKPEIELILFDMDQGSYLSYGMKGDLRELAGGHDTGKSLTLEAEILVDELPSAKYEVYLSITDSNTGQRILLANEQDVGKYGYCIGTIERYE